MPGNFQNSKFRKLHGPCRLRRLAPIRKPGARRQRGYIDLTGFIVFLVIVGVLIGIAVAYGVPWLWSIVKPLLHSATS